MNEKKMDMIIGMLCSISAQLDELLGEVPGAGRRYEPRARNLAQEDRLEIREAMHRHFRFGELAAPDVTPDDPAYAEYLLALDDLWKAKDAEMRSAAFPKSARKARRAPKKK